MRTVRVILDSDHFKGVEKEYAIFSVLVNELMFGCLLESRHHYFIQAKKRIVDSRNRRKRKHSFSLSENNEMYNVIHADDSPEYLAYHVHQILWWGLEEYLNTSFDMYMKTIGAPGLSVYANYQIYNMHLENVVKLDDILGETNFKRLVAAYMEAVP